MGGLSILFAVKIVGERQRWTLAGGLPCIYKLAIGAGSDCRRTWADIPIIEYRIDLLDISFVSVCIEHMR